MKYIGLSIIILMISLNSSYSQWIDNGNNLTTTDNIGIGTTAPKGNLHISDDGLPIKTELNSNDNLILTKDNGAIGLAGITGGNSIFNRTVFKGTRVRSTLNEPTTPKRDDYVLSLLGAAWDGNRTQGCAAVDIFMDGDASLNNTPMRISFVTSPNQAVNRQERMTIKSDGKIGIGTTTPSNILSVDGIADFTDKVGIGTTTPSSSLSVEGSADFSEEVGIGTTTPSNLLSVKGSADFTDRVGIGTINPIADLHIAAEETTVDTRLNSNDNLILTKNQGAIGLAGIAGGNDRFYRAVFKGTRVRGTLNSPSVPIKDDYVLSILGAAWNGSQTQGCAAVDMFMDGNVSSGNVPMRISFSTSPTVGTNRQERMTIKSDGKIGIGTTTPTELLTVAGQVYAQRVRVNVDAGADFVFEEDYELMPLEEVAAYVKENKHLPEIPSEQEMIEEDLQLGEFSVKLLQKVEELTLYMIELKEENEAMKKEIEELKAKGSK